MYLELFWIPVFTGMTNFYELIKNEIKAIFILAVVMSRKEVQIFCFIK